MVHIPKKPKNDSEFLEVMSRIIFVAGFRWSIVDARWPQIKKAFNNFNLKKVVRLKADAIMKKEGMIKNKGKITAIIENAKICQDIIKEHKTIMKYFSKIQRNNKKDPLFNPTVQEECLRFLRIGKTTSRWLAYVVTRDKKLLNHD